MDDAGKQSMTGGSRTVSIQDALKIAVAHQLKRNLIDAEKIYQSVIEADPGNFDALHMLGLVSHDLRKYDIAEDLFNRAKEIRSDFAPLQYNIGRLMKDIGRVAEALECFAKAIEYNPGHAEAYNAMAGAIKFDDSHGGLIEQMQEQIQSDEIDINYKSHIYFALGKAFDDMQQYDKAFEYYKEGNRIVRSNFEYDIEQDKQQFEDIKRIFSKDFFVEHQGWGCDDASPLFILGMPRSGTSLVEQILSSHSQIYGAGELDELKIFINANEYPANVNKLSRDDVEHIGNEYVAFLRDMSANATYISDKMPDNFRLIGMIYLVFPNAKIIHCTRRPLDTCTSIYKNMFSCLQRFAYDQVELAQYYLLYQDLMQHWQDLFPLRIYNISYEAVVNDIEDTTHKLLDHLGLPFEEECLAFHNNNRPVTTASNIQVRSPIYNSSIGMWDNYKTDLYEMAEWLGEASPE